MKKCPACNRTFDDTMTFCLVDGSVLSAPFDPKVTESHPASRSTDPDHTAILYSAPNPAATIRTPETDKEPNPLPQTIAAPIQSPQRETAVPLVHESSSPEEAASQAAMKTMKAASPDVMFRKDQQPPFASETVTETHSAKGKLAALIAAAVLVVLIAGAIVWLIQRTRTPKAATAAAKQTTQTENKPPPTGQIFRENSNGAEIQLVSVPGGTFLMGSPLSETGRDNDEGPQNDVTIPSLYISKYEVTQAQYKAVMGTNPSSFKGDDLPVDSVSWNDAVEFCRKLSRTTGREYRLPTEAEWEYASRAKTTGPFAGNVDAMTWYDANSDNRTHPVGQKEPNGFGLYDMNGNVWEWCQSKYKPYPYRADDGREDLQSRDVRVMRGGSWRSPQKGCRSAYRRRVPPDDRTIGFRIILTAR